MITENSKIKGSLILSVKDKNGNAKKLWNENCLGKFLRTHFGKDIRNFIFGSWQPELRINNIITNTGRAGAASRFNGAGGEAAFTFLAVGTGTATPAVTDTALGAEITTGGLARAAATVSRVTGTVANDTARLDHSWTATTTLSPTELGAFNAATAGIMAGRVTFAAVGLVSGDVFNCLYSFRFA